MHNLDSFVTHQRTISSLAARVLLSAVLSACCRPSTTPSEATPITPYRSVHFAGRDWQIKSGQMGPGNNYWNSENVFTDRDGLHLRISNQGSRWTCSEVSLTSPLGYGCYTFEVDGLQQMSTSEVLGLFLYQDDDHEYDVELGRFGNIHHPGAQYVVQPINAATVDSNRHRFSLHRAASSVTTHTIDLRPNMVSFSSYNRSPGSQRLQSWTYSSTHPISANSAIHLNYWLYDHMPPPDGRPHEIIIRNFTFSDSCPE